MASAPRPRAWLGLALLVALLASAACGSDGDDGGSADEDGPSIDEVEVSELEGIDLTIAPVANLQYPTAMAARPGTDALWVTEQAGRVRVLRPGLDGALSLDPTPALDISEEVGPDEVGGEPGLLGLAFSADGARLYLSYTHALGPDEGWDRRIAEWTVSGEQVVPGSQRVLLSFHKEHPQHNGGDVRFGPDGYLYAGFGDTAPVGDAFETGQDPTDLLGGIIRIDPARPEGEQAYGVPPDNPWITGEHEGRDGLPENWLYGTRNPWRFSFDRATGDLWVADVGDLEVEEITLLRADESGLDAGRGANLGWSDMEGSQPYRGRDEPADHHPPLYDYEHSTGGCSVIGGYVYRGHAIPALQGTYLFSDYCAPTLRGIRVADDGTEAEVGELGAEPPDSAVAFGEDLDGELYLLTSTGVYAILDASEGGPGATSTTAPQAAPPTSVSPVPPAPPATVAE